MSQRSGLGPAIGTTRNERHDAKNQSVWTRQARLFTEGNRHDGRGASRSHLERRSRDLMKVGPGEGQPSLHYFCSVGCGRKRSDRIARDPGDGTSRPTLRCPARNSDCDRQGRWVHLQARWDRRSVENEHHFAPCSDLLSFRFNDFPAKATLAPSPTTATEMSTVEAMISRIVHLPVIGCGRLEWRRAIKRTAGKQGRQTGWVVPTALAEFT
jgi:hypothetical protein